MKTNLSLFFVHPEQIRPNPCMCLLTPIINFETKEQADAFLATAKPSTLILSEEIHPEPKLTVMDYRKIL